MDKVDPFDPAVIVAFIVGALSDAAIIFGLFAIAIPVIGIVFFIYTLFIHYLCGIIVTFAFWHRTRGWKAKLVVVSAALLPLPLLAIGIVFAVILSNQAVSFVVDQGIRATLDVLAEGSGEAFEGAELVGTGIEEGVAMSRGLTEGVEAVGEGVVQDGGVIDLVEGAEGVWSAPETGEALGNEVSGAAPEDIGEKPGETDESAEEKALEGEMETKAEKPVDLARELLEPGEEGELPEGEDQTQEEKIEEGGPDDQLKEDGAVQRNKIIEITKKTKEQLEKLKSAKEVITEEDEEEEDDSAKAA